MPPSSPVSPLSTKLIPGRTAALSPRHCHTSRYVEKRLLQDHIAKLEAAARERDALDNEIETCVCGLFERLRLLEATNEELAARLGDSDHHHREAATTAATEEEEEEKNDPS